jgi:pimeloyl-ACP methyl ester carboxylesterase
LSCARHGRRHRHRSLRSAGARDHIAAGFANRYHRALPALVLVGDGDELTPPDLAHEIAGGIADARLVIVPDCGHLSTIERPEAVHAAVAEWLAGPE